MEVKGGLVECSFEERIKHRMNNRVEQDVGSGINDA